MGLGIPVGWWSKGLQRLGWLQAAYTPNPLTSPPPPPPPPHAEPSEVWKEQDHHHRVGEPRRGKGDPEAETGSTTLQPKAVFPEDELRLDPKKHRVEGFWDLRDQVLRPKGLPREQIPESFEEHMASSSPLMCPGLCLEVDPLGVPASAHHAPWPRRFCLALLPSTLNPKP